MGQVSGTDTPVCAVAGASCKDSARVSKRHIRPVRIERRGAGGGWQIDRLPIAAVASVENRIAASNGGRQRVEDRYFLSFFGFFVSLR